MKRWTIGISVFVHVAGVLVVLGAGFWKIEKLVPKDVPVINGIRDMHPQGDPAPQAGKPETKTLKKAADPNHLHQVSETPPVESTGSNEPTPGTGPACVGCTITGTGDDPEAPIGPIGTSIGTPEVERPEIEAPVEAKKPEMVPKSELNARRTSGDPQIQLPDSVVARLHAQGVNALSLTVMICVNADGSTRSIGTRASSGYADVDAAVEQGMRSWRYAAAAVNGQAITTCAVVDFQYRISE